MWDDTTTCYNGCNTYACEHHSCREDMILSYCTQQQEDEPISAYPSTGASERASQAVYMAVNISIVEPVRLNFDYERDLITFIMTLDYQLQWQDERLHTSPCRCAALLPT